MNANTFEECFYCKRNVCLPYNTMEEICLFNRNSKYYVIWTTL